MPQFSRTVLTLGAAACLAGLPQADVHAQKVDFAGKKIEAIVPFAPGGGSDVYIRALQPYLEKHLPGQPTLLVRNVPGARSIPGANQFQERAKPDGTHIIVVSATTASNFVFQKSAVRFQLDKWEPVLLSPQSAVVYALPSLGVSRLEDMPKLKDKPLVFGGQSASSAELRVVMTLELLGLKPKFVWGLNRGPVRLAFERGEMNINYDSAPGYLKGALPLVKAGKAVPLYSLGVVNEKGEIVRDPNTPDLPTFVEAYEAMHGKKPSGPGYEAWLSVTKMLTMMNKAIFLPTGTPQPVLDAWRNAVRTMLEDPEFDKTAGQVIEGYPQFVGESAKPIMRDALTFSPEAWRWIRDYLKTAHNVNVE